MILQPEVAEYLAAARREPDPVLAEMEEHGERDRIPIVVPETGVLLQALALAAGARRAVEVGTAIGVSTLHIARGMGEGGQIVSFEIDPERHAAARDYLDRAGVGERADLRLVDAREGLTSLEPGTFDFAFLDGVKQEYDDYLGMTIPLLREGGLLAVDNTLLGGTVAGTTSATHWTPQNIEAMRAFNARILDHPDLTAATVLPVGDGVTLAVRA